MKILLDTHIKNPFDRMLLCQALRYGLTIISTDNAVRAYSSHIAIFP